MIVTKPPSGRWRLPALRSLRWRLAAAVGGLLAVYCGLSYSAGREPPATGPAAYQQAASYSRAHSGLAVLVMKDGKTVYEDYARGTTPDQPLALYSGTKSFSCAIAVAAAQDGLLELDEPVAKTIREWEGDAMKEHITIRQLLSLTSGMGEAGRWPLIAPYADAPGARVSATPGTAFQYAGAPFQVFGELMRRKLHASRESPLDYLQRRVFAPIGLTAGRWKMGRDANPRMPAGAFLTAREWAKYGQLVLDRGRWRGKAVLDETLLAECFKGSGANPGYGLTFWLPGRRNGLGENGASTARNTAQLLDAGAGEDIVKAAGRGGQKLYIIPSKGLVIVRLADRWGLWHWGFRDADFLAPILRADGVP